MTAGLTAQERADLAKFSSTVEELTRRQGQRFIDYLFPDEDMERPVFLQDRIEIPTIHARGRYPRHLEHFKAGATYRERLFRAANRVGKTVVGGYETALHLTGEYPDWWEGRRFRKPIRAWAAGKTNETTRDIVQLQLLGPVLGSGPTKRLAGTGTIPGRRLGDTTWKSGVPNLVDTIAVKHTSGGWSHLGFKTYEQGRGSFEGTAQDLIWFDEEPPLAVYTEALTRTATTDGLLVITFTPLAGISDVVKAFLPPDDV